MEIRTFSIRRKAGWCEIFFSRLPSHRIASSSHPCLSHASRRSSWPAECFARVVDRGWIETRSHRLSIQSAVAFSSFSSFFVFLRVLRDALVRRNLVVERMWEQGSSSHSFDPLFRCERFHGNGRVGIRLFSTDSCCGSKDGIVDGRSLLDARKGRRKYLPRNHSQRLVDPSWIGNLRVVGTNPLERCSYTKQGWFVESPNLRTLRRRDVGTVVQTRWILHTFVWITITSSTLVHVNILRVYPSGEEQRIERMGTNGSQSRKNSPCPLPTSVSDHPFVDLSTSIRKGMEFRFVSENQPGRRTKTMRAHRCARPQSVSLSGSRRRIAPSNVGTIR